MPVTYWDSNIYLCVFIQTPYNSHHSVNGTGHVNKLNSFYLHTNPASIYTYSLFRDWYVDSAADDM